jgi:hypothetical protein
MSINRAYRAASRAIEQAAEILDAEAQHWNDAATSGLLCEESRQRADCYARLLWQMMEKVKALDTGEPG